MKPIKLTEEQKEKLLEICKILFPEDVFSFNNDDGDDGIIDRNFAGDNISSLKRLYWKDKGSHFHWFEFCMTYLVGKLKKSNERSSDFIYKMNQEMDSALNNINKVYKSGYINVTETDCKLKKCPCYSENPKWLYSKDEDGLNSEVTECGGGTWYVTLNDFCINHPIDYLYKEFKTLTK